MAGKQSWEKWIEPEEVILTKKRPSPFRILSVEPGGIMVEAASRTATLSYARLDALHEGRDQVLQSMADGVGLIDSVNDAWEDAGVGHDYTNESQYWAVVETRFRRERSAASEEVLIEGGRVWVAASRVERNPRVRAMCIKAKGTMCCVCHIELGQRYPGVGDGFVHVHHLRLLSDHDDPQTVTVEDVVPVCPNCHAMLHRRNPPFEPEEMRSIFARSGGGDAQQAAPADGAPPRS